MKKIACQKGWHEDETLCKVDKKLKNLYDHVAWNNQNSMMTDA